MANKGSKVHLEPAWRLLCLALCFSLGTCFHLGCKSQDRSDIVQETSDERRTELQFSDATAKSGLTFRHETGAEGKFQLAEAMTGGIALLDFDNDGLEDLYFCSGRVIRDKANNSPAPVFFANRGSLLFRDITFSSRLPTGHYCLGAAAADFDNDGFVDLYLSNWGSNTLLRNNGDGTWSDVTDGQTGCGDKFGAGVCFCDFNQDGWLDLFVGNYVDLPLSQRDNQPPRGRYPGPLDFAPTKLFLLENQANGQWLDCSEVYGISDLRGTAMGVIAGDLDLDSDFDVYVANDEMPNYLLLQNQGKFEESGYTLGVAVDSKGNVNGSMGVDVADVDNDGLFDILVTSFERELVTLYQRDPTGSYVDTSVSSRIAEGTAPLVTWGCGFGDLDNDGDRDVFIASGHFDKTSRVFKDSDLLYENLWDSQKRAVFQMVTPSCRAIQSNLYSGRGIAIGDLDADGDLDLVVSNWSDQCVLYENTASKKNFLDIRLIGTLDNRSAVGGLVEVRTKDGKQVDQVFSGRGYQGHWGSILHFGLGNTDVVDSIQITWPNRTVSSFTEVQANQRLVVVQPTDSVR